MKKLIKIILIIYLILSIPFLFYLYYTNHSIFSTIQNNDNIQTKIDALDNFKINIMNMSMMSKYYLITGDEYYKGEFEINYKNTNDNVNNLYESEYISESERDEFLDELNNYKGIVQNNTSSEYTQNIDSNMKNQIRNLTDIEINIIDDTSSSIYSNINEVKNNSGYAINLVSNQNNILELVGGFFTMIFLCPLFFISKNYGMFTGIIKNFISEHFSKNTNTSSSSNKSENQCDDRMLQCINESIIKNFQEKINDKNMLVSTLRIIYSHSEYMEKEWKKGKNILDSVENDLLELRRDLDSLLNKSEIPYERFNVIENKLLEVKFLLEKLPGYHDFIMKLTEPYNSR